MLQQPRSPLPLFPTSFISSDFSSSPASPVRHVAGLDLYPALGGVATPWQYSDADSVGSSTTASTAPSGSSSPEESLPPTPQPTGRVTTQAALESLGSSRQSDTAQSLPPTFGNAQSMHLAGMPLLSSQPLTHSADHTRAQQHNMHMHAIPLHSHSAPRASQLSAPLYASSAMPFGASSGPMMRNSSDDSMHHQPQAGTASIPDPSHSSISTTVLQHPHQPLLLLSSSARIASSSSHDTVASATDTDTIEPSASTSSSQAQSSALLSSRKRPSASEDVLRERARKRLENHKRYDRKRAVVLHEINKDLREVIHTSRQIIQGSRIGKIASAEDKKIEDEEDAESDSATRLPSRMELEALSHSELFLTAGKAIRALRQLKRRLESQLQALPEDNAEESQIAPAMTSRLATPAQTQQLNVLLSAVQSASRLYLDQLNKFQALVVAHPRAISDVELLPVHAVGGLTGRHFNSILKRQVLLDHLPAGELQYLHRWGTCEDNDLDMYRDVNCPQLLQIYAMCALLSKNFAQQLSEYHQHFFPNADQVLEFLQQSVRSQLARGYDSTALLSASPTVGPRTDEHPLNQYSIPPACFKLVGDVLNSLANLSEAEYNREVDLILPLLRPPIPIERIRAPHFPRISCLDSRDRSTVEFMFSKYFTPTWAQMRALADLWTGRKTFVHFPGLTQMSPSDKVLQADFDFAFLLNPSTGEKVGLISFLKRLYFTDPVHTVDKTVAPFVQSPPAAGRTVDAFATAAAPLPASTSSMSVSMPSSNAFVHSSPAASSSVSSATFSPPFTGAVSSQTPFSVQFSQPPSSS